MLGQPHVEHRVSSFSDGLQAALDSRAYLIRVGYFFTIRPTRGGFARIVRTRVKPATGDVLSSGGITLGVAAQDLRGARRIAAIVGNDEQHRRFVELRS